MSPLSLSLSRFLFSGSVKRRRHLFTAPLLAANYLIAAVLLLFLLWRRCKTRRGRGFRCLLPEDFWPSRRRSPLLFGARRCPRLSPLSLLVSVLKVHFFDSDCSIYWVELPIMIFDRVCYMVCN